MDNNTNRELKLTTYDIFRFVAFPLWGIIWFTALGVHFIKMVEKPEPIIGTLCFATVALCVAFLFQKVKDLWSVALICTLRALDKGRLDVLLNERNPYIQAMRQKNPNMTDEHAFREWKTRGWEFNKAVWEVERKRLLRKNDG